MTWVLANLDTIGSATWWHLAQAVPAIILSFLLALPVAKLANYTGVLRAGVSAFSGLLYAIPSLPLFIVLPLILGTGLRSPINIGVALTLYGLALMIPGAMTAFRSVDSAVLQAATAQGYPALTRFFGVELPLAGPALLATLRVVTVSTMSLVTVGGVLGISSLGSLFTDGFQRGIHAQILTGIILTAVLALLLDQGLVLLGKILMPWTRSGAHGAGDAAVAEQPSDLESHHPAHAPLAGRVPENGGAR